MEEIVDDEEPNEDPVIEEALPKAPEAPLPEIRKKQDVEVPFAPKKFDHLPARESQHKEAPYPKSKKMDPVDKKDQHFIDIEDKDPLWLKDKGDHFYKRHDYHSALNAYSKSIQNDRDFLMSRLNRGTTFLRTREF